MRGNSPTNSASWPRASRSAPTSRRCFWDDDFPPGHFPGQPISGPGATGPYGDANRAPNVCWALPHPTPRRVRSPVSRATSRVRSSQRKSLELHESLGREVAAAHAWNNRAWVCLQRRHFQKAAAAIRPGGADRGTQGARGAPLAPSPDTCRARTRKGHSGQAADPAGADPGEGAERRSAHIASPNP